MAKENRRAFARFSTCLFPLQKAGYGQNGVSCSCSFTLASKGRAQERRRSYGQIETTCSLWRRWFSYWRHQGESVQLNHPASGFSHASSTASGIRAARMEPTAGMDKHFRFPKVLFYHERCRSRALSVLKRDDPCRKTCEGPGCRALVTPV